MTLSFSKKTALIKPSPTLSLNTKVLSLQKQGIPITNLAVGEPHFPVPSHICEAINKALKDGFTQYTPVTGITELRESVAEFFCMQGENISCSPESTIITNGAKQSLYNLFQALLDPGDEVIVPAPYWVSYPDMIFLAQGKPVIVPTTIQNNFKITIENLEHYITPKTKILVFNTPSNPTGLCYTKEEVDTIFEWSINKGIFIIVDEIYSQLIYPPSEPVNMFDWWLKNPKQIALINGLSKAFSMTGLRVGFTLTDPSIINILAQIQGQSTANVCSIMQKAALAALKGPQNHVQQMVNELQQQRDIIWEQVKFWSKTQCIKPDGAFYIFPDISMLLKDLHTTTEEFCLTLLEKLHIAVLPGENFGSPGCIRISYAVPKETLISALQNIHKVFI